MTPNPLNQITLISMTTKLPTEKRFYITTKFEKYAVYSYMARDEHHALELHEDGLTTTMRRSGESTTKK